MAAPGPLVFYATNLDVEKMSDLLTATVKMALFTSTYTPDTDESGHDTLSDTANQLATGFGYTSGGATLGSKLVTAITNGFKFSSAAVTWTAAGGAIPVWRHGVLYVSGSLWGKTDPLVAVFVADTAPADYPATQDTGVLTINCPSGGWFDKTRS